MKCPNCGNEAQDDAIFCDQCGTRLKAPVAVAPVSPGPVEAATVPQVPETLPSSAPVAAPPAPAAAAPEVAASPATACPNCGHNNTPGEMFCSECGTRLAAPTPEPAAVVEAATAPSPATAPAAGICPVCGATVSPSDEFCDACGADLRAKAAAPVAPAPEPAAPPPQAEAATMAGTAQAPVAPAPQPAPQAAPTCPTCGTVVGADDTFCQNCGAALVSAVGAAPAQAAPAPAPVQPTPAQPAPAPVGANPRLVVADSGIELPLKAGRETLVGREDPTSGVFPDVDLTPHGGMEGGVSRRHCKITLVGGQYVIEDLNSTNYTMVNRQRVQPGQAVALNDGDEVRAGRVRLIFKVRV
jgi:predicted amidophosphoribosyltransferase